MPNRMAVVVFLTLSFSWCALLVLFNAVPQIDTYVSAHFFVKEACASGSNLRENCGHFPYRHMAYLEILRVLFFRLPYVIAIIMLWKLLECHCQHGATFNAPRARALKIALGSLLIGPGLIANVLLKDFWGRPRPFETLDFGGSLAFVEAGSLAGTCISNCSFVSGEAAGAGWLLCLIFFVPSPARFTLAFPLAAISLIAPALRLAFGAHYLSDVVLGWLLSLVIFAGLVAFTDSPQREKKSEI